MDNLIKIMKIYCLQFKVDKLVKIIKIYCLQIIVQNLIVNIKRKLSYIYFH